MLVELLPGDPPATLLSLAAGVAVIEALATIPPHYSATLKWPNDVLLGAAKAGGILLERQGLRLVIGFGINLAVAPDVPGRPTASFDPQIDTAVFARALADAFGGLFDRWRTGSDQHWLIDAWQACASRPGTPMEVHDGSGQIIAGTFDGLEDDGALRLLQVGGKVQVIRAGDVEL